MSKTLRCTETLVAAAYGRCPIHGGDNCLYMIEDEELEDDEAEDQDQPAT